MVKLLFKRIKKIPKHSFLLLGIILFVFIFPLFEKGPMKEFLVRFSYTIILLSVASIIEFRTKWMIYVIAIAVFFQWLIFFSDYQNSPILEYISLLISLSIFTISIYMMIKQIIGSPRVDTRLIIETITGYLLLGIVFTLINVLLTLQNAEAIGLSTDKSLGDIIYYSFITFTTIGYGDISPISQVAKSFAILFGLIGQLYLTIIIAFIIGKYLSSKNK